VAAAVTDYLKPLVLNRTTDRIEQLLQICYMSSYYKNDTVLNSAIAGVCDALWDIKGRQAGMPVYQSTPCADSRSSTTARSRSIATRKPAKCCPLMHDTAGDR
jgi:hypothetical protein